MVHSDLRPGGSSRDVGYRAQPYPRSDGDRRSSSDVERNRRPLVCRWFFALFWRLACCVVVAFVLVRTSKPFRMREVSRRPRLPHSTALDLVGNRWNLLIVRA
jgi:hypothetical protein